MLSIAMTIAFSHVMQTNGIYIDNGNDLLLSSSDLAVVDIDMQPIFYFVKHENFVKGNRSGEFALQELAQVQRRVINAVVAYRSRHHKTETVNASDLYRGVFFTEWTVPEKASDFDGHVWYLSFDKSEGYFIQSREIMRRSLLGPGAELFNRLGCDPVIDPKLTPGAPDNISQCSPDDRVDLLIRTMPELQDMLQRGAKKPEKYGAGAFGPGSELPQQLHEYFVDEANRPKIKGAGHCPNSNAPCDDKFKTMILMGVTTDYCVLATAVGAMDAGYHVLVVEDAVSAYDMEAHWMHLKYTYNGYGAMIKVVHSEELIRMLLA
eukprot:gnl/MRDRNA2_/MRDRNA2_75491_c0_seq1.p1 gnl/MRDRNA2_/MRDRNA2_75491_c0~~gnl/MRDRNA2_/MRDRNA2_75491_c0_seq1.p1  ORF type:complete len:321 (-),score=44.21 gnl/MRDRNA2_/MRDRNA2_75491_c0_seq1:204-1166(-)